MSAHRLAGKVASWPLFSGVPRSAIENLCAAGTEQRFEPGTVLIEAGRLGAECYAVLEGRLAVTLPDGSVKESGPGEIVGEMGLMKTNRRTATVRVVERTRAVVLHGSDFHRLMQSYPEFRERIEAQAEARRSGDPS